MSVSATYPANTGFALLYLVGEEGRYISWRVWKFNPPHKKNWTPQNEGKDAFVAFRTHFACNVLGGDAGEVAVRHEKTTVLQSSATNRARFRSELRVRASVTAGSAPCAAMQRSVVCGHRHALHIVRRGRGRTTLPSNDDCRSSIVENGVPQSALNEALFQHRPHTCSAGSRVTFGAGAPLSPEEPNLTPPPEMSVNEQFDTMTSCSAQHQRPSARRPFRVSRTRRCGGEAGRGALLPTGLAEGDTGDTDASYRKSRAEPPKS